jgi:hypothetical protein
MQNPDGYEPVIFSSHKLILPRLNWKTGIHVDCFNFADTSPYKIYWQMECDEIVPATQKIIDNHEFYDLILCWNNLVLSECPNARFFPSMATVWTENADTSQKQFQVSMLSSSKVLCEGHKFRHEIYKSLGHHCNKIPVTKYMSPPYLPSKMPLLEPFQYTIVMENAYHPNYFTEKILDAFATKTIPVYWGCPNIRDFFNIDGIFEFDHPDHPHTLRDVLSSLRVGDYAERWAAIEDNYQRAMKYYSRTESFVQAITDAWTPKIPVVHSGEPNVAPES